MYLFTLLAQVELGHLFTVAGISVGIIGAIFTAWINLRIKISRMEKSQEMIEKDIKEMEKELEKVKEKVGEIGIVDVKLEGLERAFVELKDAVKQAK